MYIYIYIYMYHVYMYCMYNVSYTYHNSWIAHATDFRCAALKIEPRTL